MFHLIKVFAFLTISAHCFAQTQMGIIGEPSGLLTDKDSEEASNSQLMDSLMQANKEKFGTILENPDTFRLQILYTQIDRDAENEPRFTSHFYRLDPEEYFYPASTIKLFAAPLALEKINGLNVDGLSKFTRLAIDSSYAGQTTVRLDSTAPGRSPTLAHYIRKMLVISDNDAYNRLYEFLGQKDLNGSLQQKGFTNTRLTHRLSLPLSPELNRHTNAFHFYDDKTDEVIYSQKQAFNEENLSSGRSISLGKSYVKGGKLHQKPMDFSEKNATSLEDLQHALREILFPGSLRGAHLFDLEVKDYDFLRQYLSQLPRETSYPDYGSKPDNYCKFFIYGDDDQARIPEHIRIFNKIGLAYGFTLDNGYIVDFEHKVEFLLTAVVYTNENQILNDGKYEYDELGFPFLAELGRVIYDYELKRTKENLPDLSDFEYTYDKP